MQQTPYLTLVADIEVWNRRINDPTVAEERVVAHVSMCRHGVMDQTFM